jgi:4-azaleucine resistance transporter AzlC
VGAFYRTVDRGVLRDITALIIAAAFIGMSFGAIAVASGVPGWLALAMSVLVFAGGSQFMAVGLLAAGSPVGALLGGLLLNARHLPFGLVVSDAVGRRWPTRLLGSHLLIDESVAFALAQHDPAQRRAAYWLTGVGLFVTWNLGTGLGVLLGGAVTDPAVFGLDAAFPAGLLALLLPSLQDPAARGVAAVAAVVALLTTPLLPAGMPVLLGLLGLFTLVVRRRPQKEKP